MAESEGPTIAAPGRLRSGFSQDGPDTSTRSRPDPPCEPLASALVILNLRADATFCWLSSAAEVTAWSDQVIAARPGRVP